MKVSRVIFFENCFLGFQFKICTCRGRTVLEHSLIKLVVEVKQLEGTKRLGRVGNRVARGVVLRPKG